MAQQNQAADQTVAGGEDVQSVQRLRDAHQQIIGELEKVIVGQQSVIDELMIAIFARGHCLLVGVPGLAKTLLVSTLSRCLSLSFKRVQFTPDLMPSDITGTEILADDPETGQRQFKFLPGPVFANIVLADEINRSSPRTQSALLEAMGEGRVTFDGISHELPRPFFVIATRNLAESHGTFPLPQSQLDRFLLSFGIGYPGINEEVEILERHEHGEVSVQPVLTADEIADMQAQVYRVEVARPVKEYIAGIVAATRESGEIAIGVSPRGAVFLQRAAQAWAAMAGRDFVAPDDVKAVAQPVLHHRIVPRSATTGSPDGCIDAILNTVPVPL